MASSSLSKFAGLPPKVQETLGALSPLQRNFVLAYVSRARGNATLAMQIASRKKLSYAAAASSASQFMIVPQVRLAITAWMEAFAMNAAELTASITDMVRVNVGPFTQYEKDGTIGVKVPDEETWEAHKHWIKSFEADPKTGKITRLELHDSMAARKELAKILKLYSDAPIVGLFMYYQGLPNDELVRQIEQARKELAADDGGQLTGDPIAVIEDPNAKKKRKAP